jgi:hypothetical protein
MGEVGPNVFFPPDALKPGTLVVVEGRALLRDGDEVAAKTTQAEPTGSASNVVPAKQPAETSR